LTEKCVDQLNEFIITKCPVEIKEKVTKLLKLPVGIVFNERLINMPPQLAPPLFKSLLEETKWMVEDV
jgi:hypothetical protein